MNSEKVSVNINDDKLAKIDMLVSEGFYSNRSSFINDAVSELLAKNEDLIDKIITESKRTYNPDTWFIGIQNLSRKELQDYLDHDARFCIKGFGILYIDNDVDKELLSKTVTYISDKIIVRCSDDLQEYVKTIRK